MTPADHGAGCANLEVDSAPLVKICTHHPRLFTTRTPTGRPAAIRFPRGWVALFRRLRAVLEVALPADAPPMDEARSGDEDEQ